MPYLYNNGTPFVYILKPSWFIYITSGDIRVIVTYLIFLTSSSDVIYFPSKNIHVFLLLL
jgi:hypothetical protein